jgi:hypothetical protein
MKRQVNLHYPGVAVALAEGQVSVNEKVVEVKTK